MKQKQAGPSPEERQQLMNKDKMLKKKNYDAEADNADAKARKTSFEL